CEGDDGSRSTHGRRGRAGSAQARTAARKRPFFLVEPISCKYSREKGAHFSAETASSRDQKVQYQKTRSATDPLWCDHLFGPLCVAQDRPNLSGSSMHPDKPQSRDPYCTSTTYLPYCLLRWQSNPRSKEGERAMELKLRTVVVAMAMVLLLVAASTTAAAGQSLCNMTQVGLAACKPCIATVKPEEKPTEACCTALKQADLPCLCSYKNSDLLPYLGIDPKQAMQLPAKCNIAPPQQC
ncbi:hypothetical protein GW17_00014831, partial [Ensete ventricosum]